MILATWQIVKYLVPYGLLGSRWIYVAEGGSIWLDATVCSLLMVSVFGVAGFSFDARLRLSIAIPLQAYVIAGWFSFWVVINAIPSTLSRGTCFFTTKHNLETGTSTEDLRRGEQ